ncbi:MAG: hypothetical protein WCJ56_12860 [bacterium]
MKIQIPLIAVVVILVGWLVWITAHPNSTREKEVAIDWNNVHDDWNSAQDPGTTLTMGWLGVPSFSSGKPNSERQKFIENYFNVKFNPIFLDDNAYGRKKPLMFAGGDIPDVCWENDPNALQRDVYHGFFMEIPHEVILKYAPTYSKYLSEEAPVAWLYSSVNGKNYGIPTMNLGLTFPNPGVWRMDWLKKVGINKVPETIEEYHEALYRIRNNDPDGNGLKDTYGMSGDIQSWWWTSFGDIFGAYGVMPFDWQLGSDGKVTWGGVRPEAKEVVELLRQWYKEGLIDPQFTTDKNGPPTKDIERKFVDGQLGYIYYYGKYDNMDPAMPNNFRGTVLKRQPKAELAVGKFPVGPTGKSGGRVWGAGGNILAFGPGVRKNPAIVIRVLKMLETYSTVEAFSLEAANGKRYQQWDYKDPAIGKKSGLKFLPPYDDDNVRKQEVMGGFFVLSAITLEKSDAVTPDDMLAFRNTYQFREQGIPDLLGKPDVIMSAGDYLLDIRLKQQKYFAEMISGAQPMSKFDEWVTYFNERGGLIMTADAEKMQQEKVNIYKKVGVPEKFWK